MRITFSEFKDIGGFAGIRKILKKKGSIL